MNSVITFLLKQVINRWADKEISNAKKRQGVLAEFEVIGLKLTESVANFALEAGVQYLKRLDK